jgi:hypothetical protein
MRFVPLNIENRNVPLKTPSSTPGNDTSRRRPSVFTAQPIALYTAAARVISSGFRGSPGELATPSAGGGLPPRPDGALRSSGASQNGSNR